MRGIDRCWLTTDYPTKALNTDFSTALYTALGLPREDSSILDFVEQPHSVIRYIPVVCMRGRMLTL
jgi:hypothetical protein